MRALRPCHRGSSRPVRSNGTCAGLRHRHPERPGDGPRDGSSTSVRNVGIKDGKIVTITDKPIRGKEVVNAKNHVVAPGFIDTHTHASNKFTIKMSMMDGVTTGLDCELGALNIAAWYEREKGKWPMNYGQCASQELARMTVHDGLDLAEPVDATDIFKLRAMASKEDGIEGWSVSVSNLEQINQISKILDENLRQGALGLGSTVGYAKTGISTYELFEAQRAAARYGRLTGVHSRFHTSAQLPMEATLGFAEVFANACLLKAPLLYCHDNDYGWWEIEEKLVMAREMGMNMWGEYYPYAAGSTSIGSEMLRPESVDALGLKYKDIMFDPSQDKFLTREEYLEIAKQDSGRTVIAFNPPRKEWMKSWIKLPHMTVGSDAMWSNDPDLGWDSDPIKVCRASAHVWIAFESSANGARSECAFIIHPVTTQLLVCKTPWGCGAQTNAGPWPYAGRHGRRYRNFQSPNGCAYFNLHEGRTGAAPCRDTTRDRQRRLCKTRQQGDGSVSWSTDPIPGRGKGSFCSGESKTVE